MTPALWFGAAVAALFIVSLAILTRPWWFAGAAQVRRRRANVAAYQTRLIELDGEAAAGLIQIAEADALKQELAARVLIDTAELDAAVPSTIRPRAWMIGVAGLLLATFAAGGYWLDGSWRLQQQIASRAAAEPKVAEMIAKLAEKLQRQPDDAEGWSLLGRSYFLLQRFDDSAKAYHEANQHAPSPNPEWLTNEGEALAFVDEQNLGEQSAKLFDQALQLQPDFGKALWYGGLAAAQRNDTDRAKMLWARLAQQDLPESMQDLLQQRMAALTGTMAPSQSGTEMAATSAGPVSLRVQVTLAAAIANKIPTGATLLVFAKADGGPPMPLAVQRLPDAKLPQQVTLDDRQSMTPTTKLSQFDRYLITARLSQSGMAQAVSGDLQGSVTATRADSGKLLNLVIDSVLP